MSDQGTISDTGAGPRSAPARGRRSRISGGSVADFLSKYGVLITLVAMIVVFGLLDPHTFLSVRNLKAALSEMAPVAVVAFGLTVVLIMGDFDLSIVGMIGLGSAIVVSLMATSGLPMVVAVILSLLIAAGIGAVNGTVVAKLGGSSFITTLAIGQVLTGINLKITGGQVIFDGIPESFDKIAGGTPILGIQNSVWIALAFFVVGYLMLEHTTLGRYMYAVGGNHEAARLSGLRVTAIRILGFVITAFCAMAAAILLSSAAAAYSFSLGSSYFLPTYAAVFLGAAVLRPGTFTILGTLIGAAFLEVVSNGLASQSAEPAIVQIVEGGVLAIAVLLSTFERKRR